MVRNLVNNGANLIWEHSLSDVGQMKSGIRKPNPKDPVQYVQFQFHVQDDFFIIRIQPQVNDSTNVSKIGF